MKIDGLWYTHFIAGQAQGDGMAVLRDGEILGWRSHSHLYRFLFVRRSANLHGCSRQPIRRPPSRGHGAAIEFCSMGICKRRFGKRVRLRRQQARGQDLRGYAPRSLTWTPSLKAASINVMSA